MTTGHDRHSTVQRIAAGWWGVVVALAVVAPVWAGGGTSADGAAGVGGEAEPSGDGAEVRIGRDSMTLPWHTSTPRYTEQPLSNNAMFPIRGSQQEAGERTFELVVLENEYLRIEIVPEAGGAVSRAVCRISGADMFYFEGRAKDWLPFWESGVKASFPFREHGIGTIQPAGWRVVRHDNGGATVAMWMEFSRFNDPWHRNQFGRYTNMLLSQHVRLDPGVASLDITYRATNPTPYRQGRQLWNDALFPRHHTPEGIVQGDADPPRRTETELIYPVQWVSGHWGRRLRRFEPEDQFIANYEGGVSLFSWDAQAPFAGLWYPSVGVNRLRLFDPEAAPGAKVWFRGETALQRQGFLRNYIEIWGGGHHVFEGVEHWIEPGESYQFTHRFIMTHGIGRASTANDELVASVHLDGDEPRIELLTLRRRDDLAVMLDDRILVQGKSSSPAQPLEAALPRGLERARLRVLDGEKVLLDEVFPRQETDQPQKRERIEHALKRLPENEEMAGEPRAWGRSIRYANHPDHSVGQGRVRYRLGRVEAAVTTLEEALDRDGGDGEGWHLLGAARLELGRDAQAREAFEQALEAERPYPPAHYYLALMHLADGRQGAASARLQLEALLQERPGHVEGKLLLAWVEGTGADGREGEVDRAERAVATDPADPRAMHVLAEALEHAGRDADSAAARNELELLLAEPGAAERLEQFKAATEGRFIHPARLR